MGRIKNLSGIFISNRNPQSALGDLRDRFGVFDFHIPFSNVTRFYRLSRYARIQERTVLSVLNARVFYFAIETFPTSSRTPVIYSCSSVYRILKTIDN